MGGPGSGGWNKKRGRKTVDSCRALDVNSLSAMGCLRPGSSGTYPWAGGNGAGDNGVASIHFRCEAEWLYLSYTMQAGGGERTESIPIVRLPWWFGGSRLYFLCPGACCGRRVGKLYHTRHRFLCRQCSQLSYASKSEGHPWQRAFRRANKLRQRLGITGRDVPGKPNDMPMHTYERLLEATLQAEIQATEAGTARLLQLIARLKPRFTL
jgi:hypothetical protein